MQINRDDHHALDNESISEMRAQGTVHILTPTEVHQNEHFPYVTATHIVDAGVDVTHNVLVS